MSSYYNTLKKYSLIPPQKSFCYLRLLFWKNGVHEPVTYFKSKCEIFSLEIEFWFWKNSLEGYFRVLTLEKRRSLYNDSITKGFLELEGYSQFSILEKLCSFIQRLEGQMWMVFTGRLISSFDFGKMVFIAQWL